MKKVSVIIPIYNVGKYLKECLDSVINQTYKELEIILVNDGSTDDSGAICDYYAEQDPRIKVIHKANEGLGFARNSGLKEVTGLYVAYVDSDDWLDRKAIETLVHNAETNNADMVVCGFYRYMNEKNISAQKAVDEIKIYTEKEDIINKVLYPIIGSDVVKKGADGHEMCVWTNLYDAQIIKDNQIKFVSEREYLTEDFFYNIDYIMYTKRVVIIPECLYYYRYNTSSLSNAYRPTKIMLLNKMTQEAYRILNEFGVYKGAGFRLERAYLKRLRKSLMLIEGYSNIPFRQKLEEFHKVVKDSFTRQIFSKYPLFSGPMKEAILVVLIKNKFVFLLFWYLKIQRVLLRILKRR